MNRQLKLMLVDDEKPSTDLLCRILSDIGMGEVVGTFGKPSEAISQLMNLVPDVAFLDIEMPGVNGLELARQMRQQLPDLFIVFITGYSHYALEAFKVEALDYILKPFMPEEIEAALNRILKYKGHQSELPSTSLPSFQIHCFGEFSAYDDQGQRVRWSTKKAQELFAYLLLNQDSLLDKERIGEALWSDKPRSRHANNLHISLYRLRKDLAAAGLEVSILSEKGSQEGYGIQLGEISCDLDSVNAYMTSAQQFPFTEAFIEYHEQIGQLMEEDLFKGMDYLWCELHRLNYQRFYIQQQRQLAGYYLAKEEWIALIATAERLRQMLPYDEQVYLWLFEGLGKTGQQSLLVSNYLKMKAVFSEELDLPPPEELERGYKIWIK